ncbi:unnamed protein product, partial [Chrysoparadoxa australica]
MYNAPKREKKRSLDSLPNQSPSSDQGTMADRDIYGEPIGAVILSGEQLRFPTAKRMDLALVAGLLQGKNSASKSCKGTISVCLQKQAAPFYEPKPLPQQTGFEPKRWLYLTLS